jgi:hypothetical protein
MSDEHPIGAALLREVEKLGERIEVLEAEAAKLAGRSTDWQKVDETRIDLDRAFDELDTDVHRAIDQTLGRLGDALRRKFAEDFPSGV